MIDPIVIKNLETLGDRYCSKYLQIWRKDIAANWWTALRFFFNHAFMRGRRDQLSEEYCRHTMDILVKYFNIPNSPTDKDFLKLAHHHEDFIKDFDDIRKFKKCLGQRQSANCIDDKSFQNEIAAAHPLIEKLIAGADKNGQRPLNNDKDLLMVLNTLDFLTRKGMPANVHNYILEKLMSGRATVVDSEIKGIYAIGDKISAFILRDIILMNPTLRIGDQSFAFPVDTWVLKIANKLGCESGKQEEVKTYFIDSLGSQSAAKVAAGLWYLGFHSLDILIVNLDKTDMTLWELDT